MAAVGLLFAVVALTVSQDGAELRESCDPSEPTVAKLAAGTPAKVRFAINGCFAVDVERDGKVLSGFLPAAQLSGTEALDQSRRAAPGLSLEPGYRTIPGGKPAETPWDLLQANRPAEALAAAERALLTGPRDPRLLAFAGLAAYRSDFGTRAVGYLKDSLAIRPDPAIQQLLEQVLREQSADRTGEPLHSTRFLFRFDPALLSRDSARALLGLLEQEFSRISAELGCNTPERLSVIVQSREDYLRSTGAAEWSAGQFDGRIRVALLDSSPAGPDTRRALAHELVHACVAATGAWPAWLHEGLAQKLSGESLSSPRRAALRARAKEGSLPSLAQLTPGWSRMGAANASLAYAASLFAVELFYEHHSQFGIRNLLRNPDKLEAIVTDLDRRIRAGN